MKEEHEFPSQCNRTNLFNHSFTQKKMNFYIHFLFQNIFLYIKYGFIMKILLYEYGCFFICFVKTQLKRKNKKKSTINSFLNK